MNALKLLNYMGCNSKTFFRLLGRNGREDISELRQSILVQKQKLLPIVGEQHLTGAPPSISEASSSGSHSMEADRHYQIIRGCSEALHSKLSEDTPEAEALDRACVMKKVSIFRQFIYKHIFHKYILLPAVVLGIGLATNQIKLVPEHGLKSLSEWITEDGARLVSSA
ncbi:MAG: hypothetical protein JSR57_12200, partial [Verrucomicrobia bacterium]|nr:hypothetical protein [Verrucomicrobiota bacterium]